MKTEDSHRWVTCRRTLLFNLPRSENTNDLVIVPDLDMNSKVTREPAALHFPQMLCRDTHNN